MHSRLVSSPSCVLEVILCFFFSFPFFPFLNPFFFFFFLFSSPWHCVPSWHLCPRTHCTHTYPARGAGTSLRRHCIQRGKGFQPSFSSFPSCGSAALAHRPIFLLFLPSSFLLSPLFPLVVHPFLPLPLVFFAWYWFVACWTMIRACRTLVYHTIMLFSISICGVFVKN